MDDREAIIAALEANPNASQVARQIGMSQWTVRRIAKAAGIELTAGNPGLPAAKRERIIAALTATPNARQVAREIGGVSYMTVTNIARAAGIRLAASRPRKVTCPNRAAQHLGPPGE